MDDYSVPANLLGRLWEAVFSKAHENELAQELADLMIAQGCEQLEGVNDPALVFMFWKKYLEDNKLIKIEDIH
jgi:hypothetical protein|tara:strand:+ start:199 stop:417 length:219 start_codon:yes stop_codon:yes gene_type:complete